MKKFSPILFTIIVLFMCLMAFFFELGIQFGRTIAN